MANEYSRNELIVFGVLLIVVVGGGLVFLIGAGMKKNDAILQKHICFKGDTNLVFPGPGAPQPPGYAQGELLVHRSEPSIAWDIVYGNVGGTIIGMDVFGPIYPSSPLDGPLLVTVCDVTTTVACQTPSPNVLKQKIKQTDTGIPLDDIAEMLFLHPERYKLRIRSTTYPNGALVADLMSVC